MSDVETRTGPSRSSKLRTGVLIVACVLLGSVLAPAGRAVAAQLTNVFVTNDNAHAIPVREQGTPTVHVAGPVLTRSAIPASSFSFVQTGVFNQIISGPSPADTSWAVTVLSVSNPANTEYVQVSLVALYYDTAAACGDGWTSSVQGPIVTVPPNDTVTVAFSQAFVLAAQPSASSCLGFNAGGPGSESLVNITVVGHTF